MSLRALPDEVKRFVDRYFRMSQTVPTDVRAFSKQEMSRAEAWFRVSGFRLSPPSPANFELGSNPWRKLHTENFWVYYNNDTREVQ